MVFWFQTFSFVSNFLQKLKTVEFLECSWEELKLQYIFKEGIRDQQSQPFSYAKLTDWNKAHFAYD